MRASSALLGFDFGSKNIGVAVGDAQTRTANPLSTIQVRDGKPDWSSIESLIETWQPGALIIGLPLNMDGTAHAVTESARRFSRQLHGRFNLPVELIDERLSSLEAQSRLSEAGRGKRALDPVAAQVILETWFEQQTSEQNNS